MANRYFAVAILISLLPLMVFSQPASACSGCLAAGGNGWAYFISYVFLSLLPLAMLSLMGGWVYRQHKKNNGRQQPE